MSKQTYKKLIMNSLFCICSLNLYCQQDLFNLDFHLIDSLNFQWHVSQLPMMKIDSTQQIQGKYPLVIFPEKVNRNSIHSLGRENHPIMLNLHQAFQLPVGYENDTVTVDLHIRPIGMNKIYLWVIGMNLHQELLRTGSVILSNKDEWQTVRCSLPLKDVRHLTVGIVGHSKRKDQFDFLPSKVYLDRMVIRVAGQDIAQVCRSKSLSVEQMGRLSGLVYENVFDESDESILQKIGLQNKKIIALGETVHGSATINKYAFEIIKNSILYDNCRLVLMETEMGVGLKMNLYVCGQSHESSIQELMRDVAGYLFDLEELESFLVWLRKHNTVSTTKVRILGIEGTYNYTSNALFDYMYEFYSEIDKPLFYSILKGLSRLQFEDVQDVVNQNKERLVKWMGSDEYGLFVDVLNGIIRMNNDSRTPEEYFYAMLNRDFDLYDNARTFIGKLLKEDEKVIVYTHYKHAQKKESVTGSFPYMHTMGSRLVAKFQNDYAVVALTVGCGEILTRYNTDSLCVHKLEESPVHTLESVWMRTGLNDMYTPTQPLGDSVYCIRSIGNSPRWNKNYEYTNLDACADGIIYFRNSLSGNSSRRFDINRLDKYRKRNRILNKLLSN